jgi:hypothetical protein
MAQYFGNDLTYYLSIPINHRDVLYQIRKLNNLKVLEEDNNIWVKDFTYEQINSIEVKALPYKILYYEKQNKLYILDSLLPNSAMPSGLWTNIERILQIEIPDQNFNYFEQNELINIKLKNSKKIQKEGALLIDQKDLSEAIPSISSTRLSPLKWTLVGTFAFIVGYPILPIKGQSYWINGGLCLPSGYDLQYESIHKIVKSLQIASNYEYYLWIDESIIGLEKANFEACSISSFRKTLE